MRSFRALSDSEMEIMQVIWQLGAPITTSQLRHLFAHKGWKIQTLATFLSRLVDKGALAVEKRQGSNLYVPAVTELRYRRLEARYVIESQYGGSLPDFLSAYYGGRGMTLAEQEELAAWFHQETSMDLV